MMETIPKAHCQKIGFIRKTRSIHGELILEFNPFFEPAVSRAKRFFLEIDGLLVPFFVAPDELHIKSEQTAFLSFEDVTSEKYARRLVGSAVYLYQREVGSEPQGKKDPDFTGYTLLDKKQGEIGLIAEVQNYSGNTVMTVTRGKEELLIPFNEELLVSLDHKKKTLTLDLPDGLLAMNP